MPELVEVYRAWGESEAQIIRGLLEASGISSTIQGESTRLTHGFTMDGLAEVRILVRPEDAERAAEVIQESGKTAQCPGCEKPVSMDASACPHCKQPLPWS